MKLATDLGTHEILWKIQQIHRTFKEKKSTSLGV